MAIAEYQEAIQQEPEYPDAHLNLALTYADQERFEDATKELRRAIELAPKDPFPRHELAAILMDEGDYRAAIGQLKEVVRLEPQNFEAWLDLGICYAQKGFYAEAERAYEKARTLQPEDLLLDYNTAALYALWGKSGESLAALAQGGGDRSGEGPRLAPVGPDVRRARRARRSSRRSRAGSASRRPPCLAAATFRFTLHSRSGTLRAMPELAFFRHGEELLRVALDDRTAIGRDPGCDVTLPDPALSRVQAVVERRGDAVAPPRPLRARDARRRGGGAGGAPHRRRRDRARHLARALPHRRRGRRRRRRARPAVRSCGPARSASGPPAARLRVRAGGRERTIPVTSAGVVVGKDPTCDAAIDDPFVSTRHLRIEPQGARWALVDLGSTNGTFISGARVTRAELPLGVPVQLGDAEIVLEPREAQEPVARRGVRGDDLPRPRDAAGVRARRAGRRLGRGGRPSSARPAPARSSSPAPSTRAPRGATARSSRSTARRSPSRSSSPSCSGTRRAPSPAPSGCARAPSRRRTAAPSSSTRSASCRSTSSRSSCASSSSAR